MRDTHATPCTCVTPDRPPPVALPASAHPRQPPALPPPALAVNPANAVALRLIGRDYISFSALSTFQQCPLRFYFKYIEKLPEHTVSASLVFGGAMHAAVEHHFRSLLEGRPPPDVATLLDVYHQAWQGRDLATIKFGKGGSADLLSKLAKRMLVSIQASDFARPEGTILAIEEELRGPVLEGLPDLLARIDLLIETDETLVLSDLKTARSRWSPAQVEDSGRQLLLYSKLARELSPHKTLVTQFAVVTKAKTPVLALHPVPVDDTRIANVYRVAGLIWQAITAGHFYPVPSPQHCATCPYRRPCRAWGG